MIMYFGLVYVFTPGPQILCSSKMDWPLALLSNRSKSLYTGTRATGKEAKIREGDLPWVHCARLSALFKHGYIFLELTCQLWYQPLMITSDRRAYVRLIQARYTDETLADILHPQDSIKCRARRKAWAADPHHK